MNVDSINEPDNKLNSYIFESLKGVNKVLTDPFLKVFEQLYLNSSK